MARLRAPFGWFGGKGNMVSKLLKLIPEHRTYVEPYCGAASLFFAKEPAKVETLNDLHGGITGLFAVLRDQSEEFIRLAELTPYSRELWYECRATWGAEEDPVRRAWKWWFVAATSFSGHWGSSLSTVVTASHRGMAATCSTLETRVAQLGAMATRLKHAQVENVDGVYCLERYCTEYGLAYVDPPYVQDTRLKKRYSHEMTDADHEKLVEALLRLPGRFVVSGYDHDVYAPLEAAGWGRVDYETACYAAARTRHTGIQGKGAALAQQARTESMWLDPVTAREKADVLGNGQAMTQF